MGQLERDSAVWFHTHVKIRRQNRQANGSGERVVDQEPLGCVEEFGVERGMGDGDCCGGHRVLCGVVNTRLYTHTVC